MPLSAAQIKSSPRPQPDQEWLSVVEVCREYGISRQTVYDLCNARKLPYYTVPSGRRRFRRAEVEPFLAPYRIPMANPESRLPDPLNGLSGPVSFPDGNV